MTKAEIIDYLYDIHAHADYTIEDIAEDLTTSARHGRWIDCDTQCGIACSICGTPVDDFCRSIDYIDLEYKPNYCPHCGAWMDGKENGNETD